MSSRRHFLKTVSLLSAGLLLDTSFLFSEITAPGKLHIKPKRLSAGDTIAITSPAGAVWDDKQVDAFSNILKNFGFKVVLGKTLGEKHGYFAGTEELRLKELHDFFADPIIKGIFCMKGGWGCARLLDKIDYDLISKNPKVLIGFSDITALLIAIFAKTGLVTFHGPVGNSGWNEFTSNSFKSVIMNADKTIFPIGPAPEDKPVTLNPGTATGLLVGGNLTVLSCIIGSGYLPDWKNKILFLEETKEEPYSIDRMLTQLKLAGVLDNISGFVFGKCVKCEAEEPDKAFKFMEVLVQHIRPLGIPAFYGAMIGHIENKLTVPLGIEATINAGTGIIQLNEAAVV
ncbi:MAG: S66 peptidase family protein [Bacteroidia bacterium]